MEGIIAVIAKIIEIVVMGSLIAFAGGIMVVGMMAFVKIASDIIDEDW